MEIATKLGYALREKWRISVLLKGISFYSYDFSTKDPPQKKQKTKIVSLLRTPEVIR